MRPFDFITASTRMLGTFISKLDRVLDGIVNSVAAATTLCGSLIRLMHTGRIQQYLTFALIGIIAAVAWLSLN